MLAGNLKGLGRRGSAVLAISLAGIASCGGAAPIGRGFGSREVLPIRDLTFSFTSANPAVVGYLTSGDAGIFNGTIALTGGQDASVSAGADAGPGDRYVSQIDESTTPESVIVTDTRTNQQTEIDDVYQVLQIPSADPTLTFLRSDAGAALTLWSGPFDAVEQVPLPVTITTLISPVDHGVIDVVGASIDQPDALGIFSIDLSTFAVTTFVPPTLGTAAWADGASAPTATLASSTLVEIPGAFQGLVGYLFGQYTYARTMDDGSTIMFAGTYPAGPASELALFQVSPSLIVSEVGAFAVVHPGTTSGTELWQVTDSTGQNPSLIVWDNSHLQLVSCPTVVALRVTYQPLRDGTKLLYGATSPFEPLRAVGSSALVVSLPNGNPGDTGSCVALPSDQITVAELSSDGNSVFWLAQPPNADPTLWTAAADGSGARPIGTGKISQPRYTTGNELEFELGGDLLWVDTNDSTNHLHPIAEQIFGTAIDLQGPWLIIGYDFSTQDGTGLLGLVNRDTGTKRLISPEVAQYIEAADPNALGEMIPPASDGGVSASRQVAYLVRGRNPSSQDGVWVATFSQADLH